MEPRQLGYSPRETAKLLNTSKSSIYRLLARGKLRAVKCGAATRVLPNSIDEYKASLPPFESRATIKTAG